MLRKIKTKNITKMSDLCNQIIFRPSSSANEDLPKDYNRAELHGKNNTSCKKYTKTCNVNVLELVSTVAHPLDLYSVLT